jgi:hypothetical protein
MTGFITGPSGPISEAVEELNRLRYVPTGRIRNQDVAAATARHLFPYRG